MTEEGLVNAMKYGSSKRASAKSLGKFGMGLKTASTAFCRRLSMTLLADEWSRTAAPLATPAAPLR
jgi:hypothetical protein